MKCTRKENAAFSIEAISLENVCITSLTNKAIFRFPNLNFNLTNKIFLGNFFKDTNFKKIWTLLIKDTILNIFLDTFLFRTHSIISFGHF